MYRHSTRKTTRLKKDAHKKIFILLICFTLAFAAFIQSERKASANPLALAVPAGITISAGAYTAGAYALAGIAGLAGYVEYQDEINAHAAAAWQNGTQLSKDAMNMMVQGAIGTGTALTTVSTDFLNWLQNEYRPDIMAKMATLPEMTFNGGTSVRNSYGGSFPSISAVQINHTFSNGNEISINGNTYNHVRVSVQYDASERYRYIRVYSSCCEIAGIKGSAATVGMTKAALNLLDAEDASTITSSQIAASLTLAGFDVSLVGSGGVALPESELYQEGVSKLDEAWRDMSDAGLVLPVDGITPYVGDKPLKINSQGDAYTDDAGTLYNPSDVDYAFPLPKIRTEDVPVPGIYTDTPALTGNPTIDDAIISNPAIPKTTTNIQTGVTIANPDIPISETPIPTPDPTPEPKPPKLPRPPGSQGPVPIMMFLAFFDLLRALIMYLVRMFNWIMTIPFIDEKPIDNPYFQWFRQAKILGVYPYTLVTSMAAFFLSFKLVTAVRRFLP